MKLILNYLTITNFKGIQHLQVDFNNDQTSIFAANEIGKTTIYDAWCWVLTGKNSFDEKDFNIKNTVRTELNRADHEVIAHITSEGQENPAKEDFPGKMGKKAR